jgi:hypothetical protein
LLKTITYLRPSVMLCKEVQILEAGFAYGAKTTKGFEK